MYVFGGRDRLGNDLGDLIALSFASRRWYVFQNMSDSPSPRSGHSMTIYGEKICIVGGESTPSDLETRYELTMMYILDTSKLDDWETMMPSAPIPPPKYIPLNSSSESHLNYHHNNRLKDIAEVDESDMIDQ